MSYEARIKELNIELPEPAKPVGSYVSGVLIGNILYMAGHGPFDAGGRATSVGKVGRDIAVDEAYKIARQVALNTLASARAVLGSLDRIKRVVKVLGMVNGAEGFVDLPKVINGYSDCMVEIFGDAGRHARSAVGVAELPLGIPVEVEVIFEIEP